MPTSFTSGGVTVTLDDGLERWVRGLLSEAERASVELLEGEAQIVRDYADQEWYRRVDRETGLSGQIVVRTRIDGDRGEVRVSVGSTDPRKDKRGRPAPAFIRAPGRTSLVLQKVDHLTYWKTPERLRHKYPFILVQNEKAANGELLLQSLIRTPMRKRIKPIARELAARIVSGTR